MLRLMRPFQPGFEKQSISEMSHEIRRDPLRYLENSPVFRADRVQTPLLMINNGEDDACPGGRNCQLTF